MHASATYYCSELFKAFKLTSFIDAVVGWFLGVKVLSLVHFGFVPPVVDFIKHFLREI